MAASTASHATFTRPWRSHGAGEQLDNLLLTGKVSEHDAVVGRHLARVVTGGECSPVTPVTEQYVLDLEREAFLSLAGTEKSQDRMQAILMTGKPLRN